MRRRNMYYATGLPGWMRFGYSPGWVGRSPSELGPCAEYLLTGRWPTPAMAAAWQGMPSGPWPTAGWPDMPVPPANQTSREQRLALLQAQANLLEQQLQALRDQIAGLKEE